MADVLIVHPDALDVKVAVENVGLVLDVAKTVQMAAEVLALNALAAQVLAKENALVVEVLVEVVAHLVLEDVQDVLAIVIMDALLKAQIISLII